MIFLHAESVIINIKIISFGGRREREKGERERDKKVGGEREREGKQNLRLHLDTTK